MGLSHFRQAPNRKKTPAAGAPYVVLLPPQGLLVCAKHLCSAATENSLVVRRPDLLDDAGGGGRHVRSRKIGDRAAERPGELEAPFLTNSPHAFLPCLDCVD